MAEKKLRELFQIFFEEKERYQSEKDARQAVNAQNRAKTATMAYVDGKVRSSREWIRLYCRRNFKILAALTGTSAAVTFISLIYAQHCTRR